MDRPRRPRRPARHDRLRRGPGERRLPGEHLVHDGGETVLVGAGIDDIGGLTAAEKEATIGDLLTARSGVYHEASNGGRELTVEVQFNPMPDPDETKLYVINAGV